MNACRRFLSLLLLLLLPCFPAFALEESASPIVYLTEGDEHPALGEPDLLEIHLINVASADCILLRMGEETFLVDSGRLGNYERIAAHLSALGIDSIDYAFASHPHDDHIGGFLGLMDALPIKTFLHPPCYEGFSESTYDKLMAGLAERGIPIRIVENETTLPFGKAVLNFYQFQDPLTSENNRSMMVKIVYGERTALLSADVSNRGQRMHAQIYGERLAAEILKMPHHGLAVYRRDFHDVVRPLLATISNVEDSIPETLDTLRRYGVPWLLTTKGTIIMTTDGSYWNVWQLPNGRKLDATKNSAIVLP